MKCRLISAATLAILAAPAPAQENTFERAEKIGYGSFILEVDPMGLRAAWNGVHSSFFDTHVNEPDGPNKNHTVNTESVSLLAQLALLRGDRETLDEMIELWFAAAHHYFQPFQITHWLLDADGDKLPVDGVLQNASGEEARMLEVLTTAYLEFNDESYLQRAAEIADGMIGVGGGQGVFEAAEPEPPHPFVFSTDQGQGGVETIDSGRQPVGVIRLELLQRNTPFGYSLFEVEVYGPDDPDENLALLATVTACSVEGPGFEPENAIDGDTDTRWASEQGVDPQWFQLDFAEPRVVDRIVLRWEAASASEYQIRFSPTYVPDEADAYLLRPWFAWSFDTGEPLSRPWDPHRVALNINNLVGYHQVRDLLDKPFFDNVLLHTIDKIVESQDEETGMFRPQYDLLLHRYFDEFGNDECTVLACADMATRLAAYARLDDDPPGERSAAELRAAARRYFDFLARKYRQDGAVWFSYDYDEGHPVDGFTNLPTYVFFAKLAIELEEWEVAEKVLREQVLPLQVSCLNPHPHPSATEPGYDGAFKRRVSVDDSRMDYFNDALAFDNLETLVALDLWNRADKGAWRSTYPAWETVAKQEQSQTSGSRTDLVSFPPVETRYVRILGLERGQDFGYSIFTLKVLDELGADLASGQPVSVSTVEGPTLIGPLAVDGDNATRWSSEHRMDPQWIYVDLGQTRRVSGVEIVWELAQATRYEVQVGVDGIFADGFECGDVAAWAEVIGNVRSGMR